MGYALTDTPDDMLEGLVFLKHTAPNLKHLIVVQNNAVLFKNVDKTYEAIRQVRVFVDEKCMKITEFYSHVKLEFCLELILYLGGDALVSLTLYELIFNYCFRNKELIGSPFCAPNSRI